MKTNDTTDSDDPSRAAKKTLHTKLVRNFGIGMPIGLALGIGVGAATGYFLTGLLVGLGLGVVSGFVVGLLKASATIEQ